jgi:hypothetical protein
MKFIYIVGLPIWGSYYGEFRPDTIKVFSTMDKARAYKRKSNRYLKEYKIIRRKLN